MTVVISGRVRKVYLQFYNQLHFEWISCERKGRGPYAADHISLRIYSTDTKVIRLLTQLRALCCNIQNHTLGMYLYSSL